MSSDKPVLHTLQNNQALAVKPEENIWLSASAGTGKTQVLTARVFRLLLREQVDPEHILCLTFTKAGAAEMAERINRQLASWVRMPQKLLRQDLHAIGADNDLDAQQRARTLFASVLDASGGGLRIMTIHSFCQSLLASFPEEAGVSSLFKPIEARDQKILARGALSDLLLDEESAGRMEIISAIQALSVRMGEEDAEKFLMRCAGHPEAMENLPSNILAFVRRLLGLPIDGDAEAWLVEKCSDENFDIRLLKAASENLAYWKAATSVKYRELIAKWLLSNPQQRAELLPELHLIWAKADGDPRSVGSGLAKVAPDYEGLTTKLREQCSQLLETRTLFEYADLFAGALDAGRAFHYRYKEAKRLQGVVDFDDMIRMTAKLLDRSDMAEWIRYKLDQRTDHILVDEAQDTNPAQWKIVHALADEFFAGQGAKPDKLRTLFTVGDFKQAIFGFQGTSPQSYVDARREFSISADASERPFKRLSLDQSFRSTPPILEMVDEVLTHIGHEQLGMKEAIPAHDSFHEGKPGSVKLWQAIAREEAGDSGEDEETWAADEKRAFAQQLALQIKEWLGEENPLWLHNQDPPRRLEPRDIMILVSKRDDLSALIVARLFAEKVPVAGIDRIRLNQPLVVQDLLAAIRFVLQPHDDLNLASLLVSPILGWSQDDLLADGYRGDEHKRKTLWEFLRDKPEIVERIAPLRAMLAMADFNSPYQFLETILSGPMQGRRKLVSRLDHAALDPMEELLNTALSFERDHIPTLQEFLDWFDRGDVEIKREQASAGNEVRLMTVHGAKGLQAPLVILANATFDPEKKLSSGFDLPDPFVGDSSISYPVVPVRKSERIGLLDVHATIADAKEMQEHWRLLYVAMTRAEEHLVVGGVLGPSAKGEAPESSWFAAVDNSMQKLGVELEDEPRWGSQRIYHGNNPLSALTSSSTRAAAQAEAPDAELPSWLYQPAPIEARPPRPLTPSDLGPDDADDPPAMKKMRAAAERGKLLHSLFQRLPEISPDRRAKVADRWLEKQRGITGANERHELVDTVLTVLNNPHWSALFSPEALAEAPIAAVVGEAVISGTVDRLYITDDFIKVVDFKTGRKVPISADKAPIAYLRQMAAYVAALEKIFPNRSISAALLYSHGPVMLELSSELIAQHKPTFEHLA